MKMELEIQQLAGEEAKKRWGERLDEVRRMEEDAKRERGRFPKDGGRKEKEVKRKEKMMRERQG